MRIALIADTELVNSNYRAYQPMHVLSQAGHDVTCNLPDGPRIRFAQLVRSDVVLIHRYVDDEVLAAVGRLRAAGVVVVWDNDDDIEDLPRENPLSGVYRGLTKARLARAVAAMVREADVVTTPSAMLAEKYAALGARRIVVLENYVRDDFVTAPRRTRGRLTVGWLAGVEHRVDCAALRIGQSLARLLDQTPELDVVTIGVHLGIRHSRYVHAPTIEFLDIPRRLASFDVGLAPLADIPFNRARSSVKLKEYAAAGVPWLASPVGPYARLGEAQGGRLVAEGRWEDEIASLLRDRRARRRLGKRAATWGASQIIGRHADQWETVLLSLLASVRSGEERLATDLR